MTTWAETIKRLRHTVDKLGKPIDTGILETVAVINMLGIETRASCEGHLDWGLPYPWVDLQPDIELKRRLHRYLAHFYVDRYTSYDLVLTLHGNRLRSQGTAFSELFTDEERPQRLVAYQGEMQALTTFMKSLISPSLFNG